MRREWSAALAVLAMATFVGCEKKEENTTINADTAAAAPAAAPAPAPAADNTAAAAPAPANLPAGVTADMVAAGNQIFHGPGNCFTCHGADAKGTALAPNLTDSEWVNGDGTYPFVVTTVTTGVAKPKNHPAPMPPKGGSQITDDQIKQVSAYVWSLGGGK